MNDVLLPVIEECERRGFTVDENAPERLEAFRRVLLEENRKYNLTAITDEREIAIKHFADCMLFASRLPLEKGTAVCDVGSGAGFPGMVMKIIHPQIEITLIDGLNKRIAFLNLLAGELGFKVNALHARAEDIGQTKKLRESFDVVTARAVASMAVLTELCLPLVKIGGCFAAMKGPAADEELKVAGGIKLLGGEKPKIFSEELPDGGQRRTVICKKISQTPTKYPRSFAKISKQPL